MVVLVLSGVGVVVFFLCEVGIANVVLVSGCCCVLLRGSSNWEEWPLPFVELFFKINPDDSTACKEF